MSLAKNKQVKEGLNNSHRSQSREALFERDGKKAAAERIDEDICLARSLRGGFRKEKTPPPALPLSAVCHSRVNLEIAELRRKERKTHFRRETRIAFVASSEKGKGGRILSPLPAFLHEVTLLRG